MRIDLERVAAHMRETAERLILPRFRALDHDQVQEKTGPRDLVTIADLEAEARLTPILEDLLPGSKVVGEEACAEDPKRLELMAGDDPIWVIDPVDGTHNFAHGKENFCSMVALVSADKVRAAWILDPLKKQIFVAEEGGGAWRWDEDGHRERLHVALPRPLAAMDGAFNFRFIPDDWRAALRGRADSAFNSHNRLGCGGQEYIRMLSGTFQFAVYTINMPWDHCPGTFLHQESGGHVGRFDGRVYRPSEITGGLVMAPDVESWWQIQEQVLADAAVLGASQIKRGV